MRNKRWFSVIISLLITAFLIILSSWILTIVVQENKNTRLVYNSISTYAWAEWANEYALLKIKNHEEWFEDSIAEIDNDYDVNILAKNINNLTSKDPKIEYSIYNEDNEYTWSIKAWEFEIIPLFYDEWEKITTNSKNPNKPSSNTIKTSSFKLSWSWNYLRNIIWNNPTTWISHWITWSWITWKIIWTGYVWLDYTEWFQKDLQDDTDVWSNTKKLYLTSKSIWDFLNENEDNYLVIYSHDDIDYSIESIQWFTLPKLKIISTSRIQNFKQNLEFNEDKNKYFDALKYSIFSK